MVLAVIKKASKLDLMGALNVKYAGVSFGLILAVLLAYRMNVAGIKSRFPQLTTLPVVGGYL